YIGSSGSTIEDMQITLKKVEAGELNTNNSVAGVCGFNDVWNGMEAVRTGSFPGKIVVYPHIENLPLTSINELKKKYPKIAAQLGDNDAWTKEAEEELLREFLSDRWA
ncbi:MAG: alcohol dehydrogenase, partial [Spirochaetes bacterium]